MTISRTLPKDYKRVTVQHGVNGNRWIKELILKCLSERGVSHIGEVISRRPNDLTMGNFIPRLHVTLLDMHYETTEITFHNGFILNVSDDFDKKVTRGLFWDHPEFKTFVEVQRQWEGTWRKYVEQWHKAQAC